MKYTIRRDPTGIINIRNPHGHVFAKVTKWDDAYAIIRAIHARRRAHYHRKGHIR